MFVMKRTEETRSWNFLFSLYFYSSLQGFESCEVVVVVGDALEGSPVIGAAPNQIEDTGSKPTLINWEVPGIQIGAILQSCASLRFSSKCC